MSTNRSLLARPAHGGPGSACLRARLSRPGLIQSCDCKTAGAGILACILMLATLFLTGCGRAPTFDILGSFFPAWLVCLALGVIFTAAARWVLSRLHIAIALPVLTYPSLTSLFACALWLALFR